MKPLGIRFENFACFEECYLPLDEGMQVLVGKNNSGKTALLRGLTALCGLPVGNVESLPFNLGGYARQSADPGNLSFHLEFGIEDAELGLLGGAIEQWPKVKESRRRLLDFHFRVLALANIVGLEDATLKFDDEQIVVLQQQTSSHAVIQVFYDRNGVRSGAAQPLRKISDRSIGAESWPILAPAGILSGLMPLKNVRMIEAHRVAYPEANMQATDQLTPNAGVLAPFLDTLSGNNRRKFLEVEAVIARVFPELEFVNPEKKQNSVFLTLTGRHNDRAIPLTHCGTGVEQVLALASFVLTAPAGSTLLLDEPHSYLHPSAEREIIAFLREHPEHRYVISTHSAILINSVSPDKIIALSSPQMTQTSRQQSPETAGLLHSLGYRNSDFLFNDRLIFVEGESDQEILPLLLGKCSDFSQSDIAKTGFPKMDGEGRLRGSANQTSLLHFEKLLKELGRSSLPRIYLFDGDCDDEARRLLRGTRLVSQNEGVAIQFLSRCEIENYLLVPEAIVRTIRELAGIDAKDVSTLSEDAVKKNIQEMLGTEDGKLFPNGKGDDPWRSVKGSAVLERLFGAYGFRYSKRSEGRLLAGHITTENQKALVEIWDLMRPIFPAPPPRGRF